MNERIRELAEQAVEQVCSKRTLSDGQIERAWHPDHFNQVFAELIVRECIDNLAWHGHDEAVRQLEWFLSNKIGG